MSLKIFKMFYNLRKRGRRLKLLDRVTERTTNSKESETWLIEC